MNMGKLSDSALQRSVIRPVKKLNTMSNAGIGVDAGILSDTQLVSNQCMCGNEVGLTALCVVRAVNSLAAAGAVADSITLSLALPKEDSEARAKAAINEAARACEQAKVKLIHGNTIVTPNDVLTVSVTAVGTREAAPYAESGSGQQVLLMCGFAGNAGASMLAVNYRQELLKRMPENFLSSAGEDLSKCLLDGSTVSLYKNFGAKLHDVEDGGVFGAIWEICERENVGCEVDIRNIPIKQVTVEICEYFDINPYTLRGDGACLAIVEDVPEAVKLGRVIGRITKDKARVVTMGEEKRFLEPNRVDDYFNIKKKED